MADFTRAGLRPSDWWREAVRPGAEQIETITELKRLIDRLESGGRSPHGGGVGWV